ncbi:MAG TPA: heme ABC exporter ATP-binding protein CcmA [Octadecabacter sp.]|nr:heme ABC exporter ATP-binding protein CcmA [Octadecabacter sp.]
MELTVSDLSVARGGVPVLSGLSFDLKAGQALVLRGANGIGKTTLLRTLAGLQPALSGSVDFPEDAGAYASHADGIKTQLTVTENLAFWADVHGADLPDSVFKTFDLEDLRTRLAGTLSAGQKRRVGLARLGVIGRKVLFLDEPTVSLDAFSVKMFASWLRDEHLGQGGIAVIATHIDLGLDLPELELEPFKAAADAGGGSDEAFL